MVCMIRISFYCAPVIFLGFVVILLLFLQKYRIIAKLCCVLRASFYGTLVILLCSNVVFPLIT